MLLLVEILRVSHAFPDYKLVQMIKKAIKSLARKRKGFLGMRNTHVVRSLSWKSR